MLPVAQNEEQQPRVWRSCCLEADRGSIIHFSQLFISFTVLALSGYLVISHPNSCEVTSPAWSIISAIVLNLLARVV